MSLQFATQRLIDSVWTLSFRWVDGKIEIVSYDRDNAVGYENEKDLPQCKVVEDENRTVTGVRMRPYKAYGLDFSEAQLFEVVNPQHVFSYSE